MSALLWLVILAMGVVSLVAVVSLARDHGRDGRSISRFDRFREVMGRDVR